MVDNNAIIEGAMKFRDGKKWKSRWGVMTKLSPVADCLHLQLYRDCKDRYKQGQTKASLSLQHFLGLESGFTLDKESNTVAIICQDLTVVLAFDTRERLIQWQVKIATHLGEDQQFLIQVSSAPPKSKVVPGPARLHIQDHKFCLTNGVPPRLLGVWEIGHLRRYGVVDGKFCFEGGSRCSAKCEGLHILGCGQASEVHQAMQLAAQGKLATRRRPLSRKMSAMDSPRKMLHSRTETRASDLSSCADSLMGSDLLSRSICEAHNSATMEDLTGRRSPWSSAESAHTDLMDSCSDATSVVAADIEMERRGVAMERCSSCISKLGAISVKGANFTHTWTVDQHSQSACLQDRTSLSSGSSGSGDCWYDRPRAVQPPPVIPPKSPKHAAAAPPVVMNGRCQCCPPERPPKPQSPRRAPPPTPRPGHAQPVHSAVDEHNYDVPRSFLHAKMPMDYYDTPKKLREVIGDFGNYDTPPCAKSIGRPACNCPQQQQLFTQQPRAESRLSAISETKYSKIELEDGRQYLRRQHPDMWAQQNKQQGCGLLGQQASCPCHRVAMGWTELLPCRRGSGAEADTGVPIHKVRLNGEGRMPVRDPSGQLSVLYATVDKTKKKMRPPPCPNYVNVEELRTGEQQPLVGQQPTANYANLDFAHSLENYENAKDILQRAGISKDDLEQQREQYIMMEPNNASTNKFPGYLAMTPAANLGRASSIPALSSRPGHQMNSSSPGAVDLRALQRKRSSSADASRFLSDDEDNALEDNDNSHSTETVQERLSAEAALREDSSPSELLHLSDASTLTETDSVEIKLMTLPRSNVEDAKDRQPAAVHIRRSSSVPCKTAGHNRDSSSSNDSGVSAGSPYFPDLEPKTVCIHSSLPRRCRSSEPLKDVKQLPKAPKSSSAEAEVPISIQPSRGMNGRPGIYKGTNGDAITPAPYPDSHSTSSGTSDMSDYIETLSLSSHSSSDIPDSMRLGLLIGRQATTTLRPRSGREYQKIDRAFIETDLKGAVTEKSGSGLRGLSQYPGADKCESPSPGYMSGSPGQETQNGQPH
ncbi:uncharacterized protein LOC132197566 isoform X2 [Neocloeon triangulifer]|uniref:uncharacterized protein LOC132197566 isoform X2 n=1 Tax=Neocloeon triangulifer TaxID=2078957 RepID=UPI00286F4E10|nr:uncharacterized protein LOC132197566 isoform X2 [Neocloeon triangulifer]